MISLKAAATRFIRAEEGASVVEYALLLALLVIACIGAINTLGDGYRTFFTGLASTLESTPTAPPGP